MNIYVVKWDKRGGKYRERIEFRIREFAVHRLNYLILDLGVHDARLITERVSEPLTVKMSEVLEHE